MVDQRRRLWALVEQRQRLWHRWILIDLSSMIPAELYMRKSTIHVPNVRGRARLELWCTCILTRQGECERKCHYQQRAHHRRCWQQMTKNPINRNGHSGSVIHEGRQSCLLNSTRVYDNDFGFGDTLATCASVWLEQQLLDSGRCNNNSSSARRALHKGCHRTPFFGFVSFLPHLVDECGRFCEVAFATDPFFCLRTSTATQKITTFLK